MITIKNLKNSKPKHPYDIKVDRSSPLGNPFPMHNESKRNEVCEEYLLWFDGKFESKDEKFMIELRRLYRIYMKYGELNLFCWCSPKRCHAETIKEFIETQVEHTNKIKGE